MVREEAEFALETIRVGLRKHPVNSLQWLALARVGASINRPDLVDEGCRHALLLEPYRIEALKFYRDFIDWSGNVAASETWIRRHLQLEPKNSELWYESGLHFERRNRSDLAFACHRKAALLDPVHPRALLHISQMLCFVSYKQGAGNVLWRVPGIIAARDGAVWSHLSSIEFSIYGEMKYLPRMLAVAPEVLRADPAICRIMAFQAMRRGSLAEARSLMQGAIERFSSATSETLQPGGEFLEYLRMLTWTGQCDRVLEALNRIGFIEGPLALSYFVLQQVAQLVAGAPEPNTCSDKDRLIISVPVWGKVHVDLWLQCGLQNLLDEANAPLFQNRHVTVQIFTTAENWSFLSRSPLFAALVKRAEVSFFDLAQLLESDARDRNYLAMTVAHWTSLVLGRRDNSDVVVLVADYIFGRGSLGYLGKLIEDRTHDVMYSVDLPIGERAWKHLSNPEQFRNGPGLAEAEALEKLFLDNLSHRVIAYAVDDGSGTVPSDPSRLNVIGKRGVEIRTMQPQLLYASKELLQNLLPLTFAATDNGFADCAVASGIGADRMMILNDIPDFICATIEFNEEDRVNNAYFPKRIDSADPVGELLSQVLRSRFLTPARIWALKKPLYVGMRRGEKSLLDVLAERLDTVPENLDHQFCRDVVLPALQQADIRG